MVNSALYSFWSCCLQHLGLLEALTRTQSLQRLCIDLQAHCDIPAGSKVRFTSFTYDQLLTVHKIDIKFGNDPSNQFVFLLSQICAPCCVRSTGKAYKKLKKSRGSNSRHWSSHAEPAGRKKSGCTGNSCHISAAQMSRRQTDRQTDIQTDRQTDTHTHTHTRSFCYAAMFRQQHTSSAAAAAVAAAA